MNTRTGLFRRQILFSRPFTVFNFERNLSAKCFSKQEIKINSELKTLERKYWKLKIFLQIPAHTRGFRTLRRRPIGIVEDGLKEGKTLDEYVRESVAQSAEIVNEEVFPPDRLKHTKKPSLPDEAAQQKRKMKPSPSPNSHKAAPTKNKEARDEGEGEGERVLKNLNIQLYKDVKQNIKSLLQEGKSPRQRHEKDVFLAEGWRLIAEGMARGLTPKAVFFSRSSVFLNFLPRLATTREELAGLLNMTTLVRTPYSVLRTWSALGTPPGVIAAFPLSPALSLLSSPSPSPSLPLTIILDQIRDPTNLGSILRSLVAVGVEKVIIMKGCCDLWDSKVFRSAAGSHFHLSCVTGVKWSNVETHLPPTHSIYLADAWRESGEGGREGSESESEGGWRETEKGWKWSEVEVTEDRERYTKKGVSEKRERYIRKGEGEGEREERERYALLRQEAIEESAASTSYAIFNTGKVVNNGSYLDQNHLQRFETISLPQTFYDQIKYFGGTASTTASTTDDTTGTTPSVDPVVLVLSGETGVSTSAKKLVVENGGEVVSIPMAEGVESLNNAVAAGVLVYEMQRQYRERERERERQGEEEEGRVGERR